MGKIKMTNFQVESFLTSELMGKLVNDNKNMPVRDRYWMSVFVRECRQKVDIFLMEKEKILIENCDKEDGKPKVEVGDQGNKMYSFKENVEKVIKEVNELASIEIVFPIERFLFDEKIMEMFSAKDMLLINSFADIKIE